MNLEDRAGLVHVGDAVVADRIGLEGLAVVRVERRARTHGEDLPGVGVHEDDVGAVRLVGLDDLVELILDHMLNRELDGKRDIVAVDRRGFARLVAGDLVVPWHRARPTVRRARR